MSLVCSLKKIFSLGGIDIAPTYNQDAVDALVNLRVEAGKFDNVEDYSEPLHDLDLLIKALRSEDPYIEDVNIIEQAPDIIAMFQKSMQSYSAAEDIAYSMSNIAGNYMEQNFGVISEKSKSIASNYISNNTHFFIYNRTELDDLDDYILYLEQNESDAPELIKAFHLLREVILNVEKGERPTTESLEAMNDIHSIKDLVPDKESIHVTLDEFISKASSIISLANELLERLPEEGQPTYNNALNL